MHSLTENTLNCNKSVKISFIGGDLSSDAGLLLIRDFASRIGFTKVIGHTTDPALFRRHTDTSNLMQAIYQIIASYGEDDCADELANEPVFKTILGKEALASQSTLSRFYNRMDETTLSQFTAIGRKMRDIVYSICPPEYILFDIDSTLLDTYGQQEGEAFNYHYQSHGYYPLLCYDGLTGDLLKAELRDGTMYCSNGAAEFMEPILEEYRERFPEMLVALRGDSGFASPDLYNVCEKYNCKYTIRLKLMKVAARVVHASRYIHFRLCSSCPYKAQFYETISNIGKLNPNDTKLS